MLSIVIPTFSAALSSHSLSLLPLPFAIILCFLLQGFSQLRLVRTSQVPRKKFSARDFCHVFLRIPWQQRQELLAHEDYLWEHV
jgi:hypothetical protein